MKTTLLAGVVALVAIVVAGTVILSHDLTQGARMIVVQGLIGSVFTVITTLLAATKADRAAVKADDAAAKTAEMHHELQNGLIPEKVKETINEMASDPTQPSVTINSDET